MNRHEVSKSNGGSNLILARVHGEEIISEYDALL